MSSWTFETFDNGRHYAEYRWNKGNTFQVIVGHMANGLLITDFSRLYATKTQAKQSFKRQVAKILGC